jgi:hypothetical protein
MLLSYAAQAQVPAWLDASCRQRVCACVLDTGAAAVVANGGERLLLGRSRHYVYTTKSSSLYM